MAITPPNLLGIARRMAYAQRKYHSGLMWMGVIKGFAGIKFSGSPNRLGQNREIKSKDINIIRIPRRSLDEYIQWKEILSEFE
jgi:hypothetical protein